MRSVGAVTGGVVALAALAATTAPAVPASRQILGVFTRDVDVGEVEQRGSATFDARRGAYRLVGNGDDLWAAKDDFHFVERPAAGDVAITATITPVSGSAHPHSKAGLMIRRDLTPDSPYVDIAVHQDGNVALQYRATRGGETVEIKAAPTGPGGRFRLERRGDRFILSVADAAGVLRRVGDGVRLPFAGAYHLGLFVCSHSDVETKTVDFSGVEIMRPAGDRGGNGA